MSDMTADDLLCRAQRVTPLLADRLVAWQRQEGRHHLPWQKVRDPYRVWLSEIMLQQTQVTTVLGYFDRFLKRFPDVQALAAAPLDEVLALWAGLGYYSRARNLHRCAQAVVSEHGGVFPASAQALQTLPGIGPSTAAAIASFCFDERVSIMDGNVKRVLSRALGWGQDLSIRAHEKALWAAADALVPSRAQDMPAYTQGLMDLGATVCTPRKPSCLMCPWSDLCVAREVGQPEAYPVKTRKLKRGVRENWWMWWQWQDQVWLQPMPDKGVWAGLWTLPLLDSEADAAAWVDAMPIDALSVERQPRLKHVLTHLDWWLTPWHCVVQSEVQRQALTQRLLAENEQGTWVPLAELKQKALPAPLSKLLLG